MSSSADDLLEELADLLSYHDDLENISLEDLLKTTTSSNTINLENLLEKASDIGLQITSQHNSILLKPLLTLLQEIFKLLQAKTLTEIEQQLFIIFYNLNGFRQSLISDNIPLGSEARNSILDELRTLNVFIHQLIAKVMDAIVLNKIIAKVEEDYLQTQTRLKLDPSLSFWKNFSKILVVISSNAHADILERTKGRSPIIQKSASSDMGRMFGIDSSVNLPSLDLDILISIPEDIKKYSLLLNISSNYFAENFSEKFITKAQKLMNIKALAKTHNAIFVTHFCYASDPFQDLNPLDCLLGGQCVGIVFNQAFAINTRRSPYFVEALPELRQYLAFLEYFGSEQLPPKLFLSYTFQGQSIVDKSIFMYQLYFKQQFAKDRIVNISCDSLPCEGTHVVKQALKLLEEKSSFPSTATPTANNHSVGIIEITLESSNPKQHTPHMIQIARFCYQNRSIYQFIDSYAGKFIFQSSTELEKGLQSYFQLMEYPTYFKTFSLQRIDRIFDQFHPVAVVQKDLSQTLKDFFDSDLSLGIFSLSSQPHTPNTTPTLAYYYQTKKQTSRSVPVQITLDNIMPVSRPLKPSTSAISSAQSTAHQTSPSQHTLQHHTGCQAFDTAVIATHTLVLREKVKLKTKKY